MPDTNTPPEFQGPPGPPPPGWQPQPGQPPQSQGQQQGWQPPPSQPPHFHGQQPGQPPQGWQPQQDARANALAEKAYRKAMRPWFKKKRFVIPLALVALVLISSLFSGNDEAPVAADPTDPDTSLPAESVEAPTKPEATKEPKAKKEPKAAEPANAKIGDTVKAGDWKFKVTKFSCGARSVGSQYAKQKAQGQFCFLRVNATNNGDKEGTLTDSNQKLLDANGNEYSSDSTASLYADSGSAVFWEGVNPGNTAKGLIVFDVPRKAKPTQAQLAGGFIGLETATVDLR